MTREIMMSFSDEMVRAILTGLKTQTRRAVKPQPEQFVGRMVVRGRKAFSENEAQNHVWNLPYQVGDQIGVRESAKVCDKKWRGRTCYVRLAYRADGVESDWIEYPERLAGLSVGHACPNGVFREGVRTWLEVTGVRIERLYEISEADAIAEGIESRQTAIDTLYRRYDQAFGETKYPVCSFGSLWESIYGKGSFNGRWAVVTEFKRVA